MSMIWLNLRNAVPLKIFILSVLVFAAPSAVARAAHVKHHPAAKTQMAKSSAATVPKAVQIKGFAFKPAVLMVAVGTTVTWTNTDDEAHTVTSATKLFHSAALDTGNEYSFTFTRAGDYSYFCSLHPNMTGKIVVK
jgi:plastocyanin